MRKMIGISALVVSSLLAACGGGGGSPGDSKLPYSISLRAEKTQLPLNISNEGAGIGAYAPYTTTLYVEAQEGGKPILGGEDMFACNVAGGLDSGSLYYLDGDEDHEDDNGNPLAYRSITLGANSGGNSFHFHAGTKSGTARITCSVTNPSDQQVSSTSVDIVVGAATGKPASVIAAAQAPGYLGSRDNVFLLRNNVGIQAFLMDDANQPIPAPGAANLQVSILPSPSSSASTGSRLLSGAQSGSVVQVRTIGGIGEVSLSSGPNAGTIVLEFVTDRFDNNVSNGIQDPVAALYAVGVYHAIAQMPLSIATATIADAEQNVRFAYALEASGGVPPYSWSTVGGLPGGLSLSSSGIIQGTPSVSGTFQVVLQVTDAVGAVSTRNLVIAIEAAPPPPPTALVFTSCPGTGVCQLPDAPAGSTYLYAFSASGGDPSVPVVWTYTPEEPAPWLTAGSAGNSGTLNGVPPVPVVKSQCTVTFLVTAARDNDTVTRRVAINVTGAPEVCAP